MGKIYLFNILFLLHSVNYGVLTLPQESLAASPPQFKHVDSLPSYLQCHEKDPQLTDCMRKSLQYILEHLKTGISEINLPVLDPTEIPKVNFDFSNDLVKGKISLYDLTIAGISGTKLEQIERKADGNTIYLTHTGVIPKLEINGKHKADVTLNNGKISSKGSFHLILTDLKFKIKMENDLYERDGHTYLNTKHIDFEPTLGDFKLEATGIFEEPALNDAIVSSINENWRQFYKAMITEARSHWEPSLIKIANNYWSYLPHDLMLLKD